MARLLILIFALTFLTGCATAIHGINQKIPVKSKPSEANVTVDGTAIHKTPITLKLHRRKRHKLVISKKGYITERVEIVRKLSPLIAGDVIMPGGTIGLGIDMIDGAAFDLSPETVDIIFQKEGSEN